MTPTQPNGPNPTDLTTVAFLQEYLQAGPGASTNPALLQRLVTAASQTVLTSIGRWPFVRTWSENYDGTGTALLTLQNWPIVDVSLLQIYGAFGPSWSGYGGFSTQPVFPSQPLVIRPSQNGQPGYLIDPDAGTITLVGGYGFARGTKNVNIVYRAGFTQTWPENQTIAGGTVALNNGAAFVNDFGVVNAKNGTPFARVASGPPQAGQYTVTATGVYAFNSADESTLVTVTYQFGQPPIDLQDAACEIAAAEYRRLQHIDQDSQGMVEATTSFTRLAIPRLAALRLDQYKNRIPAM